MTDQGEAGQGASLPPQRRGAGLPGGCVRAVFRSVRNLIGMVLLCVLLLGSLCLAIWWWLPSWLPWLLQSNTLPALPPELKIESLQIGRPDLGGWELEAARIRWANQWTIDLRSLRVGWTLPSLQGDKPLEALHTVQVGGLRIKAVPTPPKRAGSGESRADELASTTEARPLTPPSESTSTDAEAPASSSPLSVRELLKLPATYLPVREIDIARLEVVLPEWPAALIATESRWQSGMPWRIRSTLQQMPVPLGLPALSPIQVQARCDCAPDPVKTPLLRIQAEILKAVALTPEIALRGQVRARLEPAAAGTRLAEVADAAEPGMRWNAVIEAGIETSLSGPMLQSIGEAVAAQQLPQRIKVPLQGSLAVNFADEPLASPDPIYLQNLRVDADLRALSRLGKAGQASEADIAGLRLPGSLSVTGGSRIACHLGEGPARGPVCETADGKPARIALSTHGAQPELALQLRFGLPEPDLAAPVSGTLAIQVTRLPEPLALPLQVDADWRLQLDPVELSLPRFALVSGPLRLLGEGKMSTRNDRKDIWLAGQIENTDPVRGPEGFEWPAPITDLSVTGLAADYLFRYRSLAPDQTGKVPWFLRLRGSNAVELMAGEGQSLALDRIEFDIFLNQDGLRSHAPLRARGRAEAAGQQFEPIELSLNARKRWDEETCDLTIHEASTGLFDGVVRLAQPLTLDCVNARMELPIELRQLDLASLVALESGDIEVTGRLSGLLPVRVQDGVASVVNGQVAAVPPGRIRLSNVAAWRAMAGGNHSLLFAMSALENFEYTSLTSRVDYGGEGALELEVALRGHNPAVQGGRPFHYNLDVETNVLSLLKSIQLGDDLNDRLGRQLVPGSE